MRSALLDFIADFANWDNSTVREYLETSRMLTAVAHNALTNPDFKLPGGSSESEFINHKSEILNLPRPLVVDPFCGGGSIPLEALRVGADAFASDLNPVPVLLNKVVLEYIPRYASAECRVTSDEGKEIVLHGLADAVRYWGNWIKKEAEKELAEFYPRDPDGATPIAYLWARTIQCEGPGCGAQVPLIRALWLCKKANRSVALQLVPRPRAEARGQKSEVGDQKPRVDFRIIVKQRGGWVDQENPKSEIGNPKCEGTVKRGSATCPCCGYTTPVARVREQLKQRHGGAADSRLLSVITNRLGETDRCQRMPVRSDLETASKAAAQLE